MSRWPERWVKLAAALLPTHVRERYREEWLTDLQGAREMSIPTSSIAVGALLFTATLDRSAPEISGIPLSVASRIQARRGIALILSSGVLLVGAWINGPKVTGHEETVLGTAVALLAAPIIPVLAIIAAAAGLIAFWRAAFLASGLAKVTAGLATIGVLSIALSILGVPVSALRNFTSPLLLLAVASLIAAAIVGIIVWSGSSRPVEQVIITPPADDAAKRSRFRIPRWALIMVLVFGGIITAAVVMMPGLVALVALPAIAVTALLLAVRTIRTRASGKRRLRESVAIALMALSLLLLVGVGALDMLELSPRWMAPGYTMDEIFAALSLEDRMFGIVTIYIWIAFWGIASCVYLVVAIVAVSNATPSTHWMLVSGFAIIAAMVFFQFWAGFSLANSIGDTLPPFRGGSHDVGAFYRIVGQFSLVFALWGAIAPRRGGTLRQAQGPIRPQSPTEPATTASSASP